MHSVTFTANFNLGEIVYLRVSSRSKGIINGFTIREGLVPMYLVQWDDFDEKTHTATELTTEKPDPYDDAHHGQDEEA
jgi:hypothetical protein